MTPPDYTPRERFWLWTLAAVGFGVINVVFLYAAATDPGATIAAMRNPISAAFLFETFLLLAALAYLLRRWDVSRLHWGWFIVLSLAGSMAFALPVVLLWRRQRRTR